MTNTEIEIQYKFDRKYMNLVCELPHTHLHIKENIILENNFSKFRVRLSEDKTNGWRTGEICFKYKETEVFRKEYEYNISSEDAITMLNLPGRLNEKERYVIPWLDATIMVDLYADEIYDRVEIELPHPDYKLTSLPEFCKMPITKNINQYL